MKTGLVAVALSLTGTVAQAVTHTFDIVIYGSSPAAISTAIQARRMGKSAVIVSPETRIGGLTTGGLGQTDIGNKKAFGGLALEFYTAVADYYAKDENWIWQKRSEYVSGEQSSQKTTKSMWTFEPSAALKILEGWERRDGLVIHRNKWLDRTKGKVKVEELEVEGPARTRRIASFVTLDETEYRGKVFVDATYEGDLMAAAGVSYFVGREANAVYGETISGIQVSHARSHQFMPGISPYVVEGDSSSGLLPWIEPYNPDEKDGDGDHRLQAYSFRMCLTDVPENRIPFVKPDNYDPRNYELLVRNLIASERQHPEWATSDNDWLGIPWINSKMPNRKTDTNNSSGFSTDFIGQNWEWPEATYERRHEIAQAHLDYQQGLMWTLANEPRIPARIRKIVSRWGTCKDEFIGERGNGWQNQLYVREARRLVGACVMTENHCWGKVKASCPVAKAAYTMDSHNVRRRVGKDGFVHNEGDVEEGWEELGNNPYGIEYAAITPKEDECANLFVPVCLSASHMAFGSIRMEPVFFALGQVAGTAAALAIDADVPVQKVDYGMLAARLKADGQVF